MHNKSADLILENSSSEEMYNNLFVNSHAIMILVDPCTLRVLDGNMAACNFYKYTKSQLKSLSLTDINILSENEIIKKVELSRSNTANNFLFKHKLSTGEVRDVEVSSSPINITGRNLLLSIIKDITKQNNAENKLKIQNKKYIKLYKQLQIAEEKYRNWFEYFLHATFIWEKKGSDFEMVSANKKAYEESNGNIVNVFGIKSRDLWKDEEDLTDNLFQCYETKKTINIERQYKFRGSGKDKFISITYSFVPPHSIQIITEDITHQKLADDELLRQKSLFETMFNTITDGIIVTDTERKIVLANKGMKSTFGYEPDELIGRSTQLLYSTTDSYTTSGKEVYNNDSHNTENVFISYYKNHEGVIFPGETFGAKLFNNKGEWLGNLGIMKNISERINSEKTKKELENRLTQAHKMEAIGTLAGGIAHDFNNILGVILGYTEMALSDIPKESSINKYLSQVLNASYRAKDLVQQILAFSRQENVECISIQPATLLKESLKMLRPSIPSTIEIVQHINKSRPIFADPTQFNQILMNLCANAFHAMEKNGGKLTITLNEKVLPKKHLGVDPNITGDTFVQLTVSDSGIGMSPEIQQKIFEPYYTTKEAGKGTGMGLSIVHGVVKSYGGFIQLLSTPKDGTTFKIFFPVIEKAESKQNQGSDDIPTGTESILFVDDEEMLVRLGERMLKRLGYKVTGVSSSIQALELFKNNPDQFDIIITDQTMPGMTGLDLSTRILNLRADIPIIICTGFSSIVSEEEAKSKGIREFASKPISTKDIAKLIRKALDASL